MRDNLFVDIRTRLGMSQVVLMTSYLCVKVWNDMPVDVVQGTFVVLIGPLAL
jgi:hypothetical protein